MKIHSPLPPEPRRPERLDFEGLSKIALAQAQHLLPRWFPAGRFLGQEFLVGDISGTPGESLSINTRTGRWADFATSDRGGDLISLFAAMHRISQADAARKLSGILLGDERPTAMIQALPVPESREWDGIFPVPADAPPPPRSHPMWGAPAHVAEYKNEHGDLLALVYRCEPPGERKQVVPLTYCRRADGKQEWRWQSLPKPRSLYGLELLARDKDTPVLIVEGEPKCDAARALIGDKWAVIAWAGGAKAWKHADWEALTARSVTIWPDADTPGFDAASHIQGQLRGHKARVRVIAPPKGVPEGWDIGDAIKEGWGADRLLKFLEITKEADPSNKLPLLYFNDIQPNLDAADFVEGLLIEGGMSIIYGESNCGKTFFMTDLSLHIAMTKPWRNRQVERGAVIYCALEGAHGISNRVAAFRMHYGLEGIDIPFAVIPSSINMLDPDADTTRLIDAIKDVSDELGERVLLVVIDTLSRALSGGNENAPDDMGALVSNTDRVRQSTGAHVCFIHHSGKDTAKGARGHSLLRAATDTEIEITRSDPQSPSIVRVTKQRDMEIDGEFRFRLHTINLGTNRRGKAVTSCVALPLDEDAEQPESRHGQHSPHSNPRRLPPNAQLAFRALTIALSKRGAMLPPLPDYPPNTAAVSATEWKKEFDELKAGASSDTKKHAFNNGQTSLLAANIITARNGLVWIVRRSSEDQR